MKTMYKVVSPIEKKDGTVAYWARLGNAHTNKDDSINVYLDTLPMNGKIQLRAYDTAGAKEHFNKAVETNLHNMAAHRAARFEANRK